MIRSLDRVFIFVAFFLCAAMSVSVAETDSDLDETQPAGRGAIGHRAVPHKHSDPMIWYCDLDVDADRDGMVEPDSADDDADEAEWTSARGAVFVFNNDDDDSDGVVDAADDWVNGSSDAFDLAPILLRTAPGIPLGWSGFLTVDQESAQWVRLFRKQTAGWSHFDPDTANPIPAVDLRAGIAFGVEARDFAQTASGAPGKWTGEVLITLELKDSAGKIRGSDAVRLRVAPFVLYSNLAPAETVYVVEKWNTTGFVDALGPCVSTGGASLAAIDGIVMEPSYDIWAQDAMEFGYSTFPAPGGPRTLPSVLRSPRDWPLDEWTSDYCLQSDFGYIYKGWYRSNVDWIDWFGNLDCTPPLPGWPLGRVYTGYQGATTMHPSVLEFIEAQAVQGPVLQIDTDWLTIGHVDEAISFVPADTGTAYRMLMPSTGMALQILQDLQSAGKGSLKVFEGTSAETTVNGLLSWSNFVSYNTGLQPTIDGVRQQMKTGLGIAETDIIDIPALFWKGGGGNRAIAHMPNMVNSLVVGGHFIAPDPFGPVDGSVDKFKEPADAALGAIGLTVDYVDNWYPYHEWWGEVHCGTNAVRTPPETLWWSLD